MHNIHEELMPYRASLIQTQIREGKTVAQPQFKIYKQREMNTYRMFFVEELL
jgi:hypothetical protein